MPISRRAFLQTTAAQIASGRSPRRDVAIAGGGTGGCAAALAALRNGMSVVMTEETAWIGGQLTSQAVPPDEHRWIETHGATRAYRAYREAVRAYYRDHYRLTAEARAEARLNPGGGLVSALCHEPKVSLAVLEAMLAPYVASGKLEVLRRYRPVAADVAGDRIRGVTVRALDGGAERTLEAAYFLDATELGDLLPLARAEFVTGAEAQRETGEPHAPAEAHPHNHQAFTVCFAAAYEKGADHTIARPEEYSFWRDYVPRLTPAWPGKLLSWSMSDPIQLTERKVRFDPERDASEAGVLNLWLYRRIARARNVTSGGAEVTLVNWPQNDYLLGNLFGAGREEAARHLRRAKQLSLSLLYWMQTEAGWKGLRLRPDLMGTEDGLAMAPYVRESRRIRAEFTVVEQHVAAAARPGRDRGEEFADSVGVGSYRIDLHPSSGGDNYIDVASLPFQIPLGALLPRRVENLLAAGKCLGVTHISNGCYRLHPVEWNTGESAGALAAYCVSRKQTPRRVRGNGRLLSEFQRGLRQQGVELEWPAQL